MATTKRMGWGALLNSVKDKKNKKEHEETTDDPPTKKLKSEKKEEPKKEVVNGKADEKPIKKKSDGAEKKKIKKVEKKQEQGKKGEKVGNGANIEKKKEIEVGKAIKVTETPSNKPIDSKGEINVTKEATKATPNPLEADSEKVAKENHQKAKSAIKLVLGERQYYDFATEEPIVLHVHPEKKEGDHDFYLDLLAKSYFSNYSQSVSYKKSKMALGFDIEFLHQKPCTIQLSSSSLSIVFSLYNPETKRREISPGLRHIFSSSLYVKCGVGVPKDMVYLKNFFGISLAGGFDISYFVLEMGLSHAPWSLSVLGTDIFNIGKVHEFHANSYDFSPNQIEYAARDAWLGFKLAYYFYDFFVTSQSDTSMHAWTLEYAAKNKAAWGEIAEQTPSNTEEDAKEEEEDEDEDEDEEGAEAEAEEVVTEDALIGAALDTSALAKASTEELKSTTLANTKHPIRNKIEGLRNVRDKAKREDALFASLIKQMAERSDSGNVDAEEAKEEEKTQVLYNWV